ncbi:MAG: Ni/Fe hydrogenase subunit alpha [Methanomassiliicoccales archaeon]|nr:Ni/Fe hydrogenase subunit alpha [Methanomassiliicoccales archaeon]
MADRIVINPVTRIEGHAKVTIFLNKDDSVRDARFEVTSFRGFEKFCEGRPYYEMPSITSRACGICPVSHLLVSAKACDDLSSVIIPRTAVLLRRLMHMGQIIQSHALNFFYLSSPDLLLGADADPAQRNIFHLMESHPDVARKGIRLRKFGQELIEQVSGKRIHSSDWIVPGGVRWALPKEKADYLLLNLPEAQDIAVEALSMFKYIYDSLDEGTRNLGDIPSYYMGLVNSDNGLEHYDGKLRIVDAKGKVVADQLDPSKYFEYIGEAVEPWSYMKFPYYKPLGYPEGTYRVGPLARLNVCSKCGTPLADEELKEFRKLGKDGIVQSTFLYHYARLVEILYCIEHSRELLEDDDICSDRVWAKASLNRGEGVGVAEAPRGTLIHHYKVDDQGMTTWVNMIIATEHCNTAYNRALTQVAKKYLDGRKLSEGLLNKVEMVIRAFDPCLSCSSHAFGSIGLHVRVCGPGGYLMDEKIV